MKKAFTIIELIAVVVVLAIILAITVPGITGIIRSSTMSAVKSDAKLVLDSIRLKKIEDDTFDPTNLNKSNIGNLLGLSSENYSALEVKINEGQTYIKITGQGKWSGLSVCGTYYDMQVNEGDCYLDFNPPVITLLGDSFVSINVGQAYNDAGATANDVEDGDITDRIIKTGTVNPSAPGTYIITYNVSDTAGREALSVTRTVYVIDVEAPVITILGDNPATINIGDTYSDAGATALDDVDGDVTSRIVTTGTVNSNAVGTYSVTYTVSDNAGHEATAVRTVNVIDNILPTVTFSMNGNATWAKTRNTTVTVSDTHTGVDTSSLKYQWSTNTTAPTEASFTTAFANGGTVSSPAGVTGGYYLWILAKDTVGNTAIISTNVFNLDNTPPVITMNGGSPTIVDQGTTYADAGATAADAHSGVGSVTSTGTVNTSTVGTYYIYYNVSDNAGNAATQVTRTVNVSKAGNAPVLATGMTPIKWNGSAWVNTTTSDSDWYSYTPADKKWANAKTADGSMWVWIPRYAYKIESGYHTSTAGTISVKFLQGVTNTANDGSTAAATPTYSGSSQTNYVKHPAFTFGTTELPGIWVSKFEMSGTLTSLTSVPNAQFLTNNNIGSIFPAVRNMETSSAYGWGLANTLYASGIFGTDTNGVDTHLIKNIEWGAIVYLAKSNYGKINEIWKNNSTTRITGCAGNSVSEPGYAGCRNTYESSFGQQASTTGTIYGIYDINGGGIEYVMGNLNNTMSYATINPSSINDKYIDRYYGYNGTKFGDAVFETSLSTSGSTSWYGDNSYMLMVEAPWFVRGGFFNIDANSGAFNFEYDMGNTGGVTAIRAVLLVGTGL